MFVPESIKQLEDYFTAETGVGTQQLIESDNKPYYVPFSEDVRRLIQESNYIIIIGDYDVDGIMATYIMMRLCAKLGKDAHYRIPHRFSEGYGIKPSIIGEIPNDALIITVDNGITGHEAVAAAKVKDCKVIIIDHHKPIQHIPNADVIIDPKYNPDGFDFLEYCGAGLAYKLAMQIVGSTDPEFTRDVETCAAIATIADTVPLIGDNRVIVKKGLTRIEANDVPRSIYDIVERLKSEKSSIKKITAETVAYYIAPLLNAPGRLSDDGSEALTLACINGRYDLIPDLFDYNVMRQNQVEEALKHEAKGTNIRYIYSSEINEGICGIIANRLSSETKKPSFAMTVTSSGDIKGSCRCGKAYNVFNLLEACQDSLLTFGGHNYAAAFTLKPEKLNEFITKLESLVQPVTEERIKWDLNLNPQDAMQILVKLESLQPFGEGCRNPMFRLEGDVSQYRMLGEEGKHLKLTISSINCLCWNKATSYMDHKYPPHVTVYGYLERNEYRGVVTPQLNVQHIEYTDQTVTSMSL